MKFSRNTILVAVSSFSLLAHVPFVPVSSFIITPDTIKLHHPNVAAKVTSSSSLSSSFSIIQRNSFTLNSKSIEINEEASSSSSTSTSSSSSSSSSSPTVEAPCYDSNCAITENTDSQSTPPQSPPSTSTSKLSSFQGQATQRLGSLTGPTVWSEFGRISSEHPSIANLGQGFPDWLPPKFAIDALVEGALDVAHNSPHQYTRPAGHPKLVNELAGRYSKHLGRRVDGMNEVAITVGASQALYMGLQTLVKPGDEVILFEPFFDLYVNQIKLAGGTPVYVPLDFKPYDNNNDSSSSSSSSSDTVSPGEWILNPQKLQNAITDKTRAIVLNSPHNPTGKIFNRSEMLSIAKVVEEDAGPQCVVLSDEVYKYIVHSPPREEMEEEEAAQFEEQTSNGSSSCSIDRTNGSHENEHADVEIGEKYKPVVCQGHLHFASLPGMWERTITISSAGKTFSATGWQVGWAVGPKELIAPIHQLLPYVQFCASTVIQEALARALPKADLPYEGYASYYEYLKAMYTRKRDLLASALRNAGFGVPDYDKTPGGGFFIFARIGKKIAESIPPERLNAYNVAAPGNVARQDWALCQWMAEEKGILCIPASPFFSEESLEGDEPLSDQFVRIAFCKTNETIHKAAERLMLVNEANVVDKSLIK